MFPSPTWPTNFAGLPNGHVRFCLQVKGEAGPDGAAPEAKKEAATRSKPGTYGGGQNNLHLAGLESEEDMSDPCF